ncbi:hypothetical protein [Acidovorax sp.]|uniref:hypothetical protein n=1 Tax=Acidovorax sp. TaxID=1872122 RepID=UPI0027B8D257|nr:hypothetical protein [Acidovorax sp.]
MARKSSTSGIGAPVWQGNWQVRSFHGFHQAREGGVGQWTFYVSSFSAPARDGSGQCNVLQFGGGLEQVAIDSQDRITILGRKYGRSRWTH